ncbi:zinc finger protein 638 [Heteronotia binoei]|uniref:zinc finger protein 638 n=1 Tax=Heteronotia binoei TaxID=13085 RepID=UPI00292F2823|nr:zinc finger protein 638 [Heteronotia binoei]
MATFAGFPQVVRAPTLFLPSLLERRVSPPTGDLRMRGGWRVAGPRRRWSAPRGLCCGGGKRPRQARRPEGSGGLSFVVFLESFAPLVNSLNLGIVSPFLLGPLQLAQIKTQLALHQLNSVASHNSVVSYALLNEAFLKTAMFNPRGNMHSRPRGPNTSDSIPREPFRGSRQSSFQGQRSSGPRHGVPQQFMGREMGAGFSRPDVQVTQHRMDPRQAREQRNQQKEGGGGGGHNTHWDDNQFPHGNSSQSQPASGSTATIQSRYTNESASSILASFGLSNEDLEELSRYPDDQLTPENMPLILRDIRMRKMTPQLPGLPTQSREKEAFHGDEGRGSVVKSKVIDYGHESKYGYSEGPLEVKVYDSGISTEETMKGFQAQQTVPTAPSTVDNPINVVEALIRQMGFQRSTPNPQNFFVMDGANKMPGLCLPPAGPGVPATAPSAPVMMPPMVSSMPPPMMPPVQSLPPPPIAPPMMPTMNQPPPHHFVPEMLETVNRHDRIQHEPRGKPPSAPPRPTGDQKNFQKMAESPIESPFGVVKASWLPVFSQADAQKLKRLPTPSMMNDYYAASPRIFPHMCSLCNVECRHLKDWIQHQNAAAHIESCRQLRQQYPDWNPESHSSSKRNERDRQGTHSPRRHSASPSPKRSRLSSSGHARHRSRSRSPGYRRTGRPRSRSPRRLPSPRHRSRSPRRSRNSGAQSTRSSSKERGSERSTRSADKALEAAVKCLGPQFVEQFHKQKSQQGGGRGALEPRRMSPEPGRPLGNVRRNMNSPAVPQKTTRRDSGSHFGSSDGKAKLPEAGGMPDKGGLAVEGKTKKLPMGAPIKDTSVAHPPLPFHRLLSDKVLGCGSVLCISDLPDDGYTDQDIEKIVLPFGKVSDFVVIRSQNEAFVEMNYKEAVMAAVKYGETVPVLVNGRRVKISIAEKPKPPPSQPQNKGNGKKTVQNVKKPPPPSVNTKKDKTSSAAKTPQTASAATPAAMALTGCLYSGSGALLEEAQSTLFAPSSLLAKPGEKKPGEAQKAGETKAGVEQKKAEDPMKSKGKKAPVEQKKPADPKKSEEAKKPAVASKIADTKKPADSKAKETNNSTDTPGTVEAMQSTEAGDSANKEAEETCVVVVSNLPEAGLSLDEISNLTKPFGGLKDVLILSSHKKAYLEITQKSADSLVKFYSCFPMCVETSKLCISMAPEFKDIKDQEAIFIAMIKDANPKANVEALHSQLVHLGNLPDQGYSELEILCVGLRFGRVDHYMVISNKKKAILQLDSAESAASMCRFLKRYPYRLGESQLTFSRSPKIEPLPVEVTRKEVRKQEPSKESPVLKKNPEGSGSVRTASVPSAKPTEAKEEPSSKLKVATAEVKNERSEKMEREAPSEPSKTVCSEEKSAALTTKPVDLSSSEVKSEKASALASSLGNEEEVTDKANTELLGNTSMSTAGDKDEELTDPVGELSEESKGTAEMGEIGASPAKTEPGVETASICETVPLGSTEAPVEELSGEDLQPSTSVEPPGTDHADTSRNLPEMSASEEGVVANKEPENPPSTTESSTEVEPETTAVPETTEPATKKPELQMDKTEAAVEKQPEVLIPNDKSTQEEKLEKKADEGSPEQSLPESQPSKETGRDQPEESSKADVLAMESALSAEATSVSKTILKALMSVPNVAKKRTVTRRKEEQKSPAKPGTRSGTIAEKKPVPKEPSQQRPASGRSNLPESKSKLRLSSLVVKVGSGKSSSQQEKDSPVETKGSSKQTQEQEARSSTMKRNGNKEKVFAGRNTRSSNNGAKPKEEEELFPFNLDEFVTVDEVTDEVETPSQPKWNPLRGKRKDAAHEPSSKRRKGKTSVARGAPEQELSFVTLDEIGEDEGGTAPAAEHLEAMPDPQVLVTVDEVNDEEELISEVAQDPQSLVTLDEITEQEDSAAHEAVKEADGEPDLKEADGEPDLKAEPLVTVDEIGEVEELPLNEPLHFKTETLNDRQEEKEVLEDAGDLLSSQMPEDPSTLVTVDEIHEDSDDQPLVTLDEVMEEDDDFLEGELNFVTVDEVGSEDEEEEKDVTSTDMEEPDATAVPEEEIAAAVAEPTEGLPSAAKQEETVIRDDASPGREKASPGEALPEENEAQMEVPLPEENEAQVEVPLPEENEAQMEVPLPEENEAQMEDAEKESVAAEIETQETTLVETEKGEGGKELEQALTEETEAEAQREMPLAELSSQTSREEQPDKQGSDTEDNQQPSELESHEEDTEAKAIEMDVEGCSESAPDKEETGDVATPAPAPPEASVGEDQTAGGEDPEAGSEQLDQAPDVKEEESCSELAPSQSPEKPEKEVAGPEREEQESERRVEDPSEKSEAPDNVEDLDFLVPKAGFFCQICSCFCVDEASMKSHCQSALHLQNKKKFMNKKTEEEKKEGDGDSAKESSR